MESAMNTDELTPEQITALEEASDKVRQGIPISMGLALLVVQYQAAKPKPKNLWRRIVEMFRPGIE